MKRTDITVDLSKLERKGRTAVVTFARTLDRYAGRAAQEFAREEKLQAPKAFTTLANSVAVEKIANADYTVVPQARYAKWVHDGARPHLAPIKPLMEWLRLTKRVPAGKQLYARARGLQRYIAAHGTKGNPFVTRTRQKMDDRVIALLRDGVHVAVQEGFGQ